jgi:NAD-dependent dihydropyrimidine dehydrogenase PreA subunit
VSYKINAECIACGSCAATCPVGAISEGSPIFVISEDCVECGACAAVCPVGAITAP